MPPWSAEAIEDWIVTWLRQHRDAGVPEAEAQDVFAQHGMDSLTLVGLAGALEEVLARPVPPTLLWKYHSPRSLAAHLAGEPPAATAGPPPEDAADGEPIAIVGLSCRFPGSPDPEAFWRLLSGGLDAITEVPAGRWDAAGPDLRGVRGGFLDHIDRFDPDFFDQMLAIAEGEGPTLQAVAEERDSAVRTSRSPAGPAAAGSGTCAGTCGPRRRTTVR
jgi:acyl carrier protein